MGARETALNALIVCRKEGAWSNAALKQRIARDRLDSRDAALATRLCYGVVQNRGKLDFYLGQLLTGKLSGLHPVVRDILHLGLYQLRDMDKIPESAAVNESVELAKKYCPGQKNAPALVNAVLRNAVRTLGTWQEPASYADRYSHPEALIALLKQNLPKGMLEPMLIADNTAPATTVQVNTLATAAPVLKAALEEKGIAYGYTPAALKALVARSEGGKFGARDLRRTIRKAVEDPAAERIIEGTLASGGSLTVDADENGNVVLK